MNWELDKKLRKEVKDQMGKDRVGVVGAEV